MPVNVISFQLIPAQPAIFLAILTYHQNIQIQRTHQNLTLFDASAWEPVGSCHVRLVNPKNGNKYQGDFAVVDKATTSILGAWSIQ